MEKCTQCEDHVRLIQEVQDALIRAGKNTVAGYTGRFAECIDEMAQEIRLLTSAMHSDGEKQCNCVSGRAQSTGGCPIHGCTF